MCATCGCSDQGLMHVDEHPHEHPHAHPHPPAHPPAHEPAHEPAHPHRVSVETAILAKNQRTAERNRGWLAARRVVALNLVSSPGAGKTTLLERLIVKGTPAISVIEGDQETSRDADRIRRAGARAVQVNTGQGCHLDSEMIARALTALDPAAGSVVMIENVGNLVCPALFDLGEQAKVLIASVTEGEDKPLKYPHMFRASSVLVLNKIDLLPHVGFDVPAFVANARRVNARLLVFEVSALRGDGMDALEAWLTAQTPSDGR